MAMGKLMEKVHKLNIVAPPPPPEPSQRQIRRRQKCENEHIKGLIPDGSRLINNKLPQTNVPEFYKTVNKPIYVVFYQDKNQRMCFQRHAYLHRAPTHHLVCLRHLIKGKPPAKYISGTKQENTGALRYFSFVKLEITLEGVEYDNRTA